MATASLQLADVPVVPIAHRIPTMRDTLTGAIETSQLLQDIPVRQTKRASDIAESRARFGAAQRQTNLDALLPEGATDIDMELVSQYTKEFGRPPLDATGKIDIFKVSDRVAQAQESRRKIAEDAAKAKGHQVIQTVIDDAKGNPRRWLKVVDSTGTVIKETDLGPDSETLSARMRQPAAATKLATEMKQQKIALSDAISQVREAQTLTAPGAEPDVVGPAAGNIITRAGENVAAALGVGSAQARLDKRAEIRFLVGKLIGQIAADWKGAISEKELAFFRQSVPAVTDDNAVWQKYLTRFEKFLQDKQSILGDAPESEISADGSAASGATAPVAPAPAKIQVKAWPSDPTKVVVKTPEGRNVIMSRAEAEQLLKGATTP